MIGSIVDTHRQGGFLRGWGRGGSPLSMYEKNLPPCVVGPFEERHLRGWLGLPLVHV